MKILKGKTYTVKTLKKKLDQVFSVYIRKRDNGVCFTCKIQKPWREMQNGHYITRAANATRFNEKNCNCQCVGCNVFRKGNMDAYALELVKKYGLRILEDLNRLKHTVKQFTVGELLELINYYEKKIYEFDNPQV